MLLVACGDSGPDPDDYVGAWRLTGANNLPLPSASTIIEGRVWVAGILQLDRQTGSFDWCWEDTSTSTQVSASDYVVLTPVSGNRIEVSYFDRREPVPDTITVDGSQLSYRLRSVSVGGQVNGVAMARASRVSSPPEE